MILRQFLLIHCRHDCHQLPSHQKAQLGTFLIVICFRIYPHLSFVQLYDGLYTKLLVVSPFLRAIMIKMIVIILQDARDTDLVMFATLNYNCLTDIGSIALKDGCTETSLKTFEFVAAFLNYVTSSMFSW